MMLRTLICFLPFVFATDSDKNAIIEDIIRSVERTLAFYESNMRLITLDDVFALRLLEGQILVMNNKLLGRSAPASDDLPSNILPRLTNVYQYSRNLSSTALNLLYRNFKWRSLAKSYVYQWPWTFAASYRYLDTSLKWPADTYRSSLNDYSKYEEFCFAELMKSGFERDCSITGVCTKVMFTKGQNLHDIEQQLLYTLLTEQSGCLSELNLRLTSSQSVEKWQAELCTNIFFTVSDSILKNGNVVPSHLQGVFLKMAFLCPFAGYMEFLHIDWLKQILSWQLSFGCWGSAQKSTKYVVKQAQLVDNAVHQKNEAVRLGERYALKADANRAVGDFPIKRNGMRRLQDVDSDGIEQIQRRQRRKERTETKENRTVRKRKLQHGAVTLMTTVVIRQRRKKRKTAAKTKDQLGFMSKQLLLTKTSDRVHSLLPVQEGCVSPLTAMAIGALSQYLRFCLLAPLSKINAEHFLFGTNYILSPNELSTRLVKVNTTQRTPTTAAGVVVRFADRNLAHDFAEDGRRRDGVKEKESRDRRLWPWVDSPKSVVRVDNNAVIMFDENNPNYEEGALALGGGAQDEDDTVDYSYPSDDLIKVVDVSRDFKGKGTKDRGGSQEGDYDSYYDNVDEDNGGEQAMAWHLDHDRSIKLAGSSSSAQVMAADSRFDVVMAVGKIYLVLLGVMFLFVWLLYRKLQKQRTRHQHRFNRWKSDV